MKKLLRYVAIARRNGRPHGPLIAAPGDDFQLVFDDGPLMIFSTDPAATMFLPNRRGVLLGTIFHKAPASMPRVVTTADLAAGVLDLEEDVSRRFWGGYVIFSWMSERQEVRIYRDPGGSLPCFHAVSGPHAIFASDMHGLNSAMGQSPTIDWGGMSLHLAGAAFPSTSTCLAGVTEIARGTSLRIRPSGTHIKTIWNPWDFASRPDRASDKDFAERLREIIHGCTAAWARLSETAILSLSGGLDSSIVASALKFSDVETRCFTMVDAAPIGDERIYAQAVADQLALPLLSCGYDIADIDLGRATFPHLPRPVGRCIGQTLEATITRVAANFDACQLFTGIGGDNVFCFLQSATPVADLLRDARFGAQLGRSINDVARLTGSSLPRVAWAAIRRAIQPAPYPWRANGLFMAPDHVPIRNRLQDHPWLAAPAGAHPGSAAHIANLMRLHNGLETADRRSGVASIAPLLSQPVVELCLSVPSWRWCRGGRDRALARLAFAGALPARVVTRQLKGGPDAFCYAVLERNRSDIRDRLLSGRLVGSAVLDRAALEVALADGTMLSPHHYVRLLELVDAEAWVSVWS